MGNNVYDELTHRIETLQKDNTKLKQDLSAADENAAAGMRELLKDVVSVFDAFDKAKTIIEERGLDASEDAQKVRDRFLNVEKTLKNKLSNHSVTEIELHPGDKIDSILCSVSDTEPDTSKEDDTIISIEKKGYLYKGSVLIRPAEVVIVKN